MEVMVRNIFIVTSNLSVFSMKILNSEVINQQSLNDGLYGLSNISIDSKNEFLNIQQDRTRQTNGRKTACLFWWVPKSKFLPRVSSKVQYTDSILYTVYRLALSNSLGYCNFRSISTASYPWSLLTKAKQPVGRHLNIC